MSAFPSVVELSERATCEIEAVRSVYEDSTALMLSEDSGTTLTHTIPGICRTHFYIPSEYPTGVQLTYKIDLITSSQKNKISKGVVKEAMDQILRENIEEEVLFHLIECVREHFEAASSADFEQSEENDDDHDDGRGDKCVEGPKEGDKHRHNSDKSLSIQVFHGKPYVDRKSTFIAHFAYVKSMEEVEAFRTEIVTDSKFSKATHNIFAYRYICSERRIVVHDYDDDGETAAGGRLAEILRLMNVENYGIAVIVTRFFGGQLLGPDRFKIINSQARELLKEHGVVK